MVGGAFYMIIRNGSGFLFPHIGTSAVGLPTIFFVGV
jgi:hypothetical protein